jgi:SAM-dependent methyltransferase
MEQVLRVVRQGASHHSLGTNLGSGQEFWKAGASKAARYMRLASLRRSDRVVDYGCGSLRIGAHFIRFLDPGCFWGLDVTDGFYEIGKTEIGEPMLHEKSPRFGVIMDAEIAEAENFGADLVYSNAVCYQVHPEEQKTYFGNLARLARKPGCQLIFNCMLAEPSVHYSHRSWAWPLDTYKAALKDLDFVAGAQSGKVQKGKHLVRPAVLRFRRGSVAPLGWFSKVRRAFNRR